MDLVLHPRLERCSQILIPELRAVPPQDRAAALRRAAATPFDVAELIALAAGLVLVTWATGHGAGATGPLERFAQVIANGTIALPLMALVAGAVQWRKTRRGLREANRTDRQRRAEREA
jgi:hypothetical protein